MQMIFLAVVLAAVSMPHNAESAVSRAMVTLLAAGLDEPQPAQIGNALGVPIAEDERWTKQPSSYREAIWDFPASEPYYDRIKVTRQPDDGNGHFHELVQVYLRDSVCVRLSHLAQTLNAKASLRPNLTFGGESRGLVQKVFVKREGSLGRSAAITFQGETLASCLDEVELDVDGPVQ